MSNSIKFNLNHIRLGLTELFAAAIDIYKFYSGQTDLLPALSPRAEAELVKARQGVTTVRPEFQVDYDEERNRTVGVDSSSWHELADPEMIYWCDKLNAISGIETRQSCSGHKKGDIGKAEGLWGYETNANLWFVCDWITDDIALRLAKVPTMECVCKMYRSGGEMIWDLSFAGNNKDKLDESMQAILEILRRAQK